jgi:cytochrome c-type biogenesis protein CcmF
MHKWTLFSWSFLTLGVALGSWWAYRELGWGGYWFWDPVENASLLPWLMSMALIHSIYATKKLNTNYKSTILLAIFTFLLSILATFLVRSGVVTSVHSFASDPNRGIFILSLLATYSFISLGLFALKGHYLESSKGHSWKSRFGCINIGNIFWVIATFVILLSLVYPLVIEVYNGSQITVNAGFFEKSFIPLLLGVLFFLALGLPASWQAILPIHYRHFFYSIFPALIISGCFYYFSNQKPSVISWAAFLIGSLVVARMIFWFIQKSKTTLTYKFYLIWLVHIVAGLFAMNVAFIETNSKELMINMKEGEKIKFANFNIHYAKKENQAIDNYLAGKVILYIEKDNKELAILDPEVRYYPVEKSQTSESAMYQTSLYDFYAVINEITKDGNVGVKLYYKPLISWLWIICGVSFICGILLLTNMRKKTYASKA